MGTSVTVAAAEESNGTWRDFLPLSAVFAIGLALAVTAFVAVRDHYQSQDQQQFRRNATYYSTSFKDDVARHVTALGAIRAFVSASKSVTRWEFSNYAAQIMPQNLGFRAVLWVPNILQKTRAAYEASLQQDGLYGLGIGELTSQGHIVAAAPRDSYLPVTFIEPFDGNDNLVGLDLARLPRFAALFNDAAKSNAVAASMPMGQALVAGTQGPVVLLAFPLRPPPAADDDAAAMPLQGYALGVLQLQSLLAEAFGPSGAPVEAAIAYQDNLKAGAMVLSAGQPVPATSWFGSAAFHQAVPFDIAGRHFLLALRSVGAVDSMTSLYVPLGASLLVIALTALLAQNMSTTILRKRLVERAVISRTAQLKSANDTLRGEVEQRRQAEAALRVARDKAEGASRAKSFFMATMSHELRTPLNAIIGFSSLLAQPGTCDGARQLDYANEILVSGQRLLSLINDILDLTQMDSGTEDDALIYLPDCIAAIVADATDAAAKAGVTLKASVADDLPALTGDSKRLSKALAHLVSNAVKFTPSGGAAVIKAHCGPAGTLIVEIIDSGVGMPPDAQDKIRDVFRQKEVFSQYDGKLGRRYDGVGLGLTYVGKVAELHEASLDVTSEPGKGTRIRLIFNSHRIARKLEVA
jgi:signal transduction histidine kinase